MSVSHRFKLILPQILKNFSCYSPIMYYKHHKDFNKYYLESYPFVYNKTTFIHFNKFFVLTTGAVFAFGSWLFFSAPPHVLADTSPSSSKPYLKKDHSFPLLTFNNHPLPPFSQLASSLIFRYLKGWNLTSIPPPVHQFPNCINSYYHNGNPIMEKLINHKGLTLQTYLWLPSKKFTNFSNYKNVDSLDHLDNQTIVEINNNSISIKNNSLEKKNFELDESCKNISQNLNQKFLNISQISEKENNFISNESNFQNLLSGLKGIIVIVHGFNEHCRGQYFSKPYPKSYNIRDPTIHRYPFNETFDLDSPYDQLTYKDSWIEKFNDEGYLVAGFDLQGHGHSQSWNDFRCAIEHPDDLALDVIHFIHLLQIQISRYTNQQSPPVFLLGTSMGGWICARSMQLWTEYYSNWSNTSSIPLSLSSEMFKSPNDTYKSIYNNSFNLNFSYYFNIPKYQDLIFPINQFSLSTNSENPEYIIQSITKKLNNNNNSNTNFNTQKFDTNNDIRSNNCKIGETTKNKNFFFENNVERNPNKNIFTENNITLNTNIDISPKPLLGTILISPMLKLDRRKQKINWNVMRYIFHLISYFNKDIWVVDKHGTRFAYPYFSIYRSRDPLSYNGPIPFRSFLQLMHATDIIHTTNQMNKLSPYNCPSFLIIHNALDPLCDFDGGLHFLSKIADSHECSFLCLNLKDDILNRISNNPKFNQILKVDGTFENILKDNKNPLDIKIFSGIDVWHNIPNEPGNILIFDHILNWINARIELNNPNI